MRSQLMRNRIELYIGHGRFIDEHTIHVDDPNRAERVTVSGRYIVIATGTKPARPSGVEFDEDRVLDSDGILDLKSIPGVDGRGRRRRDRHRVRVDVRRAGHQGHRRREARQHAGVLRPRDHRGAEVPPARPGGHVPLRRGGHRRRRRVRGHRHDVGQRQADPRRDGHVLRGPPGPDRPPRPARTPVWRPTTAVGSSSTTTSRPRSTTSTPSATSSASRRWPRRRWTRAGWPPTTRSASPARA